MSITVVVNPKNGVVQLSDDWGPDIVEFGACEAEEVFSDIRKAIKNAGWMNRKPTTKEILGDA